jgi:WD40 repeat protein
MGSIIPHSSPVSSICIIGDIFLTSENTEEPLIKVWDLKDFSLVRSLKGHNKGITHIVAKT